jgi:hypothetical protein
MRTFTYVVTFTLTDNLVEKYRLVDIPRKQIAVHATGVIDASVQAKAQCPPGMKIASIRFETASVRP